MKEYHKIQSIYLRDPATKHKNFLMGEYSFPEFKYLENLTWTGTEKIDGTNVRVRWDGKHVSFGGRTDNAQMPVTLLEILQQKFTPEKMLAVFGEKGGLTLYGEGYGARIQSGGHYLPDRQDFILFDIEADGDIFLRREDIEGIAASLEIDIVPIVFTGTLPEAVEMVKAGFNSKIGTAVSEGLVLRPNAELKTRLGERVITKIKCKDFYK